MNNKPIGVFDSGLGGLTVVKEISKIMPTERIIYFGDTGRVPYGTRSHDKIIKYALQDMNFLSQFDIKMVIIACGTVSSVALHNIVDAFDLPVVGVVEPASQAAVRATKMKKIGILGTSGTINSGAYERKIKSLDDSIACINIACPMFVPFVENGFLHHSATRLIAEEYLAPLKNNAVDTIILGCTHYPLLKEMIYDIMGADVELIDAGAEAAKFALALLEQNSMLSEDGGNNEYYVSDSVENFGHLGGLFLEQHILNSIKKINIEEY